MIWDFIFKALFGLFVILVWAYLLVFIDWLSARSKREVPSGLFVAGTWLSILAVSWMMCYGVGSFVIDLFFR